MNYRSLFVPGIPAPQGSKRHVGHGVMVESSKKVAPWRADIVWRIREAGWQADPLTGPVSVRLDFVFPRLVAHLRANGEVKPNAPKWKATKPDIDKLERSVLDAITSSGVLRDDAQVVHVVKSKTFGQEPGVTIALGEAP